MDSSDTHIPSYNSELIYDIPLVKVKTNPEKRIRKLRRLYKNDLEYIGLRESMKEFGLIHPIILDTNFELVIGFRRFFAATELSWKTIAAYIKNLTEEQKLDYEISENVNRKNFNDYEFYIAIAKRKRLYEKNHPDTIRGKYTRNSAKKVSDAFINETISFMDQRSESFTEHYSKIYGLTRRALEYKIQIGEAFLDEKFTKKTENLTMQKKITQTRLISILRKKEIQNHINSIEKKDQKMKKKKNLRE